MKSYSQSEIERFAKIINANKSVIEETAKKYGKKSSSNGWWIYSGEVLTIPAKQEEFT